MRGPIIAALLCVSLALPAGAQNPRGGFFDDDFATKGFFDEKVPGTSDEGPSSEVPGTSPPAAPSPMGQEAPVQEEDSFAVQGSGRGSPPAQDVGPDESMVDKARPIADRLREVQERMEAMKSSAEMTERLKGIHESLQRSTQATVVPTQAPQVQTPPQTPEPEEITSSLPVASRSARPSVSVFVRGDQKGHLLQAIERALKAKNRFGARIQSVYIVSAPNDLKFYDLGDPAVLRDLKRGLIERQHDLPTQLSPERLAASLQEAATPFVRALHALDLAPKENELASDQINKLAITTSPSWVVHDGAMNHVFEGPYDPSELFSPEGDFIGAAQFTPAQTNSPNTVRYEGLPGVPLLIETSDPAKNRIAYLENTVPAKYLEPSELPVIPRCEKSAVRRQLVAQQPALSPLKPLDILVFAGANNRDRARTASVGDVLAVPYHSGANAVHEKASNPWLSFALTLDIRCLPTRQRRIQVDGKEYLEHLEGEKVWEAAAAKVPGTS